MDVYRQYSGSGDIDLLKLSPREFHGLKALLSYTPADDEIHYRAAQLLIYHCRDNALGNLGSHWAKFYSTIVFGFEQPGK